MCDHHKILDVLCKHDVRYINCVDCYNRAALYLATLFGNISSVDVLLHYDNIDVTVEDRDGENAYSVAQKGWDKQSGKIIKGKIKNYTK